MKYVGWDWASQAHDVTVLDDAGAVLDRWAFSHSEAGWQMTLARLRRHGDPGDLPVIIEKTSGLIAGRLLAAGHPVVPVHPASCFAARPRWGASGAKSDPGDSYKLADYLRTDGHRLRRSTEAPLVLPATTPAAMVGAHVQQLRSLQAAITGIEHLIAGRAAAHPRRCLLAALPAAGTINLAQPLAEVGPILDRTASAEQAAAECGTAPVTRASGKTTGVYFRRAASTRARKAI